MSEVPVKRGFARIEKGWAACRRFRVPPIVEFLSQRACARGDVGGNARRIRTMGCPTAVLSSVRGSWFRFSDAMHTNAKGRAQQQTPHQLICFHPAVRRLERVSPFIQKKKSLEIPRAIHEATTHVSLPPASSAIAMMQTTDDR